MGQARDREAGDPCISRFKVHWDGYWWRVFELAQPNCGISHWPDARLKSWQVAMDLANEFARLDRKKCARKKETDARRTTTRPG